MATPSGYLLGAGCPINKLAEPINKMQDGILLFQE